MYAIKIVFLMLFAKQISSSIKHISEASIEPSKMQ